MRNNSLPKLVCVALAAAVGTAACGGKQEGAAASATQVAARINSKEISVHQINSAMSQYEGLPPEQAKQAAQQTLEKLIDQELMVQKAVETKLDRDATIMMAVENARRQVLAQAHLERALGALAKPTPPEIASFYTDHPELFAQRQIYRLQEMQVEAKPDTVEKLRAEVQKARSMDDVTAWLKAQNINFKSELTVKPAEQLSLDLLPRLASAKAGKVFLLPMQDGVFVVQVVATQSRPLSEKEATPYIEQFLVNRERVKIAEKEVKSLRDAAKVEYVGEFATRAAALKSSAASAPN